MQTATSTRARRAPTAPRTHRAAVIQPTRQQPEAPDRLTPWRSLKALADTMNEGADSPSFTVNAIRHHVYQAEDGKEPELLPYVRRLGRKILISEPGFLHWIETRSSFRQ